MNSFFVPQLGSQINAMGGMTTHLHLLADKPGEYPGFSAMFSGDGFSDMRFIAKAVSASDFDAWLERARTTGSGLDEAGYAELAKPSQDVPPATYRSVEPKLFDHILDQTTAGPGNVGIGGSGPPIMRHAGVDMLGRLTWAAIPFNEPLPIISMAVVLIVILAVLALVTVKGVALSVARVADQRRPQAHRRHVRVILGLVMLLRGYSDAIMMRTQQAIANFARRSCANGGGVGMTIATTLDRPLIGVPTELARGRGGGGPAPKRIGNPQLSRSNHRGVDRRLEHQAL
jgi:hypothetical protein